MLDVFKEQNKGQVARADTDEESADEFAGATSHSSLEVMLMRTALLRGNGFTVGETGRGRETTSGCERGGRS